MQSFLQQEWAFVQHSTQGLGKYFHTFETEISKELILALFMGRVEAMSSRKVARLPVKQEGIYILDPTHMAHHNRNALCVVTRHLVAALQGCT